LSPKEVALWALIALGFVTSVIALFRIFTGRDGSSESGIKFGPFTFTALAQSTTVLVVGFLAIGVSAYYLANQSSGQEHAGASDVSTTAPRNTPANVPNVYNLPVARGLEILEHDRFTNLRTAHICSNSVGAERIREVILDNHPADVSDETSIVNEAGAVMQVAPDTALLVKVSNGQGC